MRHWTAVRKHTTLAVQFLLGRIRSPEQNLIPTTDMGVWVQYQGTPVSEWTPFLDVFSCTCGYKWVLKVWEVLCGSVCSIPTGVLISNHIWVKENWIKPWAVSFFVHGLQTPGARVNQCEAYTVIQYGCQSKLKLFNLTCFLKII